MNTLRPGDNDLAPLDYSDLHEKILAVLQNNKTKNPFSISNNSNQLVIDIDQIAFQVATLPIENPLRAYGSSAGSATVNFSPGSKDSFNSQVQLLRDCLRQLLESILAQREPKITLEQYVTSLITDLSAFHSPGNISKIGLNYNFDKYKGLNKQRLSLQHNNSGNALLKFHKLTIKVENSRQLEEELKSSINNFINIQFATNTEDEREDIRDSFNDLVEDKEKKSDFYKLKRLMDTQALGKVQREAKIRYLEFILDNLGADKDAIYLEDLIRRLRLIEQYINDEQKSDGHYQVNYAGHSFNYKDIFSTSDAFDMLPIISLIEGQLGETTDEERGELQFIFGLKLKFNGKVQSEGGREVFERNLNLLNPDSEEHKEGLGDTFKSENFAKKVLKIAFLYYFVFSRDFNASSYEPDAELTYNPISSFETKALPFLQGSDETKKEKLFRNIKTSFERFKVGDKINKLKQLLCKNLPKKFQPRTYPIQIGVKQGILERDSKTISNRNTLFKQVFNESSREEFKYSAALRYISVGDPNADPSFLCALPASIHITDIEYFSTTETQTFSMEYDIAGIRTLPVLLFPKEDRCVKICENNFQNQKLLVFHYEHQRLREQIFKDGDSIQAFVYRFAFSLLAYTCLKLLLDAGKTRLFIPIIRLHLNDKENSSPEEEFMRSLFSSISHLLNEEQRSNSQGFCIKNLNSFTIRNGLTSLYSVLPKKFQFSDASTPTQVDKLAIIVVSSRESDASKRDNYKISNFLGEVVRVQRQLDGSIRLQLIKTFSDNYSSQQIHNNPTVLLDEVSRLYKQGYRHILYIAKAPYSRTLNRTRTEQDEDLFFMSKAIISALITDKPDIKIYPIFFDKYYVVKRQPITASSLYIQDVSELTILVEDPSKQAVVFFNLFNGITVPGDDRYYNGVISYATLLNIYEGLLDDKDLRMGLIYDGLLKNELLQYLTLFHFSRYEAAPRKDRNISLKLDPYQNIIGTESVGANSIFKHMTGGVKFNSLAFLTEVRKALNVQQENKQT